MNSIFARDVFYKICDLETLGKDALSIFCNGRLGELFIEYKESEVLKIENGVLQSPDLKISQGFGLRSFDGDFSRYFYSSDVNDVAVRKAVDAIGAGYNNCRISLKQNERNLYPETRFMNSISLQEKMSFLKGIDEYARSKSDKVRQVVATLASSWQSVCIVKDDGKELFDVRPLVRLSVMIVTENNGMLESGSCSGGGRYGYESIVSESIKISYVDEALRQCLVKSDAIVAPVGEMPVVLGNGWTGILLHEAVGHGLEGDAIRKKTSAFYNLLGESIASDKVTVLDDGTISNRRGSINIDDEGSCSQRNVLIENGKLVGFMQDRLNANLMNMRITGNGRRESYEYMPVPRMTNTYMLGGDCCFDEMISSVQKGLFAKSFADGQVDTASGKFVFSASEAYLIENGKITAPVKGAMLIGDGPSVLQKISMVGNDFSLDPGVGTCGKDGQWVPVGVGQPSALIDSITVGGANL